MEIFDREWCNIYLWTVNGSALFYVERDRTYWATCFEVLSEFWWAHLVPAKHALAGNKRELAETYRCTSFSHTMFLWVQLTGGGLNFGHHAYG